MSLVTRLLLTLLTGAMKFWLIPGVGICAAANSIFPLGVESMDGASVVELIILNDSIWLIGKIFSSFSRLGL